MRILVQACCGPCVSVAVERLLGAGHEVALFYSNANLWPPEEYVRRLEGVRMVCAYFDVPVYEDTPDEAAWRATVGGADEPEGGERCRECFRYRLQRTHDRARELNFDAFTTSLTVSPHKRSPEIFDIARNIGGDFFLAEDFKKRGGFQRGVELAKALGLYRQAWCGCVFSHRERGL